MTLLIKKSGYICTFKKLRLNVSMSLWKEFQLLQILKDLSIISFLKPLLYENNVKLLKSKRSPV